MRRFRLVELGCGDGANLLPLAYYNSDAAFVGIDSSSAQIDRARAAAAHLGLDNIQFVLRDIRRVDAAEYAPCDYVIAHGLYSWIPEDARAAVLEFCRQALSCSGLAYISYNAQPGWATRRLVRETLLRDRSVRDAAVNAKAQRAIELATRLLEDLPSRDYASAVLVATELERVRDGKAFYVLHEYLAEVNEGFWLRDFVADAQTHDLSYVADAQFCRWEGHIPGPLRDALAKRDLDPIEQEEMADLLGNRHFRASIICLAAAPRTSLSRADLLQEVFIASSLRAESDPFDLTDGAVERFVDPNAALVTLDTATTKAAVVLLAAQWPIGMRLKTLCGHASSLAAAHGCVSGPDATSHLISELMLLFEAGQVELRLTEPAYHNAMPEYPRAHSLARWEAGRGELVTTPHHVPLRFEPEALMLIHTLDGSRSRNEIEQAIGTELTQQTLSALGRWGLLEQPPLTPCEAAHVGRADRRCDADDSTGGR